MIRKTPTVTYRRKPGVWYPIPGASWESPKPPPSKTPPLTIVSVDRKRRIVGVR